MTNAAEVTADHRSQLDPVTGTLPRALLRPGLEAAVDAGLPFAVFLFDVDFFKTVNDAYGHLRGDEILRQLSERVAALSRSHDSLYRYGGDEFVILLPATEPTEAVGAANRLAEGVREQVFPGEPPLHLSMSLGVACFPADGTDATALLDRADRRNYLAKRRGRGRAVADDDQHAGTGPATGRLWERDAALAGTADFLTRLGGGVRGALRVAGPAGAGYTRFLTEVAAVASLRGFTVVRAEAPIPVHVPKVLVVADVGIPVPAAVPVNVAGVVTAGDDLGGLPLLCTAELTPWSPATLRVWLRSTLYGEPSRALVNHITGRSGGLPARAVRELERLRERGGLMSTVDGGWTVAAHVLSAPKGRGRLPVPLTGLVGRDRDVEEVARLLRHNRLVTLVGSGGIGKTRLSLSVASAVEPEYADGAVFVPLAEATDEHLVVAALARALKIVEVADQPLADTVIEQLTDAALLLVLDNFEQALDGAGFVGEILDAAAGVSALVSSRERLDLYGEQMYKVSALPDEAALLLFEQRAAAADPDFTLTEAVLPAVTALCRRLDGLPLAIELAAARIDRMAPAEMLDALAARFDSLGSGPRNLPERQQTLRGAVDWSYDLLDAEEQRVFVALASFAGGCTPDAVTAVVGESVLLRTLADKSLLVVDEDEDEERYRMLETIRAYALERLHGDPAGPAILRGHAAHFLAFAEESAVGLAGPDQATWAGRVEREYQNLRAAFTRADTATAARICLGLWRYWRNGNHLGEGRDWLDRTLSADGALPDALAAQVLHAGAVLAATQDDHERASALAAKSLQRARAVGDLPTIAQANNALGIAAIGAGDHHAAVWHFRESLGIWQELQHPQGAAAALGNLTKVSLRLGNVAAADRYAGQCLKLERDAGNTRGILLALECVGQIRLAKGRPAAAREALDESLALSREVGDVFGAAMALHQLGLVALSEGDRVTAVRLLTEAMGRRHEVGDRLDLAISLEVVAHVVVAARPGTAARLLGAADALRFRHRLPVPPEAETFRAATLRSLPDHQDALGAGRQAPIELIIDEVLALE